MSLSLSTPRNPIGNVFVTPWEFDGHIEHRGATLHVWKCSHREGYDAYAVTHQPHPSTRLDFVKPTGTAHYTSEAALYRNFGMIGPGQMMPEPTAVPPLPRAPSVLPSPLVLTTHGVKITVPEHLVALALQERTVKAAMQRWGNGAFEVRSAIENFLCLALSDCLFPLYESAYGRRRCAQYANELKAAVESHQPEQALPRDRMALKQLRFLVAYPRELPFYSDLLADYGIIRRTEHGFNVTPGRGQLPKCEAVIALLEASCVA